MCLFAIEKDTSSPARASSIPQCVKCDLTPSSCAASVMMSQTSANCWLAGPWLDGLCRILRKFSVLSSLKTSSSGSSAPSFVSSESFQEADSFRSACNVAVTSLGVSSCCNVRRSVSTTPAAIRGGTYAVPPDARLPRIMTACSLTSSCCIRACV